MGGENKAEKALKDGAKNAVVVADQLHARCCHVARCHRWQDQLASSPYREKSKLHLNGMEVMMVFETAKGFCCRPKPKVNTRTHRSHQTMQKSAGVDRDKALENESKVFAKLAKTTESQALIGLFLNDQLLKKAKGYDKTTKATRKPPLGAGIMGGGIAPIRP